MKAVNVFLGVLAGAAAGGLVGVLFAPEKGSRTRRQIANKADDYNARFKSHCHKRKRKVERSCK
jgi:gas vesicle protein